MVKALDPDCEWCGQIDFEWVASLFPADLKSRESPWVLSRRRGLDREKARNEGVFVLGADRRFRTKEPPRCSFCRALFEQRARWPEPGRFGRGSTTDELRAYSLRDVFQASEEGDQTILVLVPGPDSGPKPRPNDSIHTLKMRLRFSDGFRFVLCIGSDRSPYYLASHRIISRRIDTNLVSGWIRECQRSHAKCNQPVMAPSLDLINCQQDTIVTTRRPRQYVALSYVWGNTRPCRIGPDRRLPELLPNVIKDAIQVTLSLGYKFLWVDQLCVDQGDHARKQAQISQMDLIYAGAQITLVAAAGKDTTFGLPGTSRKPRAESTMVTASGRVALHVATPGPGHAIENSKWASRGWTYQECLLSRRVLIFTEEQAYYECGCMVRREGRTARATSYEDNIQQSAIPSIGPLYAAVTVQDTRDLDMLLYMYRDCVKAYFSRELTKEEDTMNAFMGIDNKFKMILRNAQSNTSISPSLVSVELRSVWGLPYPVSPAFDPGVTRRMFIAGLKWTWYTYGMAQRKPQYPSWTWAGWTLVKKPSIRYNQSSFLRVNSVYLTDVFVPEIRFEYDGRLVALHEVWDESVDRLYFSQPSALLLDVVLVPKGCLRFMPGSRWSFLRIYSADVMLDATDVSQDDFRRGRLELCLFGEVYYDTLSFLVLRPTPMGSYCYERAGWVHVRKRGPDMDSLLEKLRNEVCGPEDEPDSSNGKGDIEAILERATTIRLV
ncbi:heterokaryon incompatibility protein-domain-containing protein [Hypomontagnella submonticulosa]|nr:heterokaryon incompatibility protein-domain-containing protein [Hypomontagnella submonticulosa]